MEDYLKGMSCRDVEALALRLGYNKEWSVVSTATAYLQTENSFNNKEIYMGCGAVWNAEWKYWSIPPGRDLRRAYEGGRIVDGEGHYTESLRHWLMIGRRAQVMNIVRRLIKDERRKMRHRRASRNHG
jgi:hypothetical protein